VTVSQYPSDPVSSPSFSTSGEYFDVQVASGSSFSSLTITDCNLNGGTSLEWWNEGAWEPVTPTSYTAGPPACVSATISSTSSPSLSQLTGTVFAAAAPATVPGAPTKVSATAGNASATLTWTAPSSDGGAAVTGYVIKVSHGPVVKVADVTSDTVTGLNNGTVYSFTVAAINAIGTGPSSAESNSVTPANATSVTGTLTVVPSTVVRGGTVTVTGKGFSAGANVSINVCNIKKVTTEAFDVGLLLGDINVSFTMPDHTPLGACKFTATGLGTNKQTLTLTTTVIVKSATNTALKLAPLKVTYGNEQVELMSVKVSPEFAAPTPTGKVTISEGKTTLCVLTLLSGKGSCSLSSKELKPGIYHLVATYGGSTNSKGSTSAKETITVAK